MADARRWRRRRRAHRSLRRQPIPPLDGRPGYLFPPRVGTPDVSVVIPVFNSARWLSECLASILAQTAVDLEVICVDDGSTDESAALLTGWCTQDPRVRVIRQQNSGQSTARNRGLDAATGRYVLYVDSDDYWTRDKLAALVRRADRKRLDLLLFDGLSFKDGQVDDRVWERYAVYYQRACSYRRVRGGPELTAAMRRNRDYRPHVGLYLARTAFVRSTGVRFIPQIVHQDNPYTFGLMIRARRTSHSRAEVYARRVRPGSTITTLDPLRSARGYFLSYLQMSRALAAIEVSDPQRVELESIVASVRQSAAEQFAALSATEIEDLSHHMSTSEDHKVLVNLAAEARVVP